MATPLFLVGSGRCGTTHLHEALSSHSQVGMTNESHVADFLVFASQLAALGDHEHKRFHIETAFTMRGILGPAYAATFAKVLEESLRGIFEAFHEAAFPDKSLRYIGDKMPDPAAVLAWRATFPETRVILMVRDPRDYVASAQSYARKSHIRANYPHLSVSIEDHATHWRNVYAGALAVMPPAAAIRYERWIREPLVVLTETLAELGLAFEASCERAVSQSVGFSSHGTSRSVLESVGRWRADLAPEECEIVRRICGEVAVAYGYSL